MLYLWPSRREMGHEDRGMEGEAMKEILSNDKTMVVLAVLIITMTSMIILKTGSENIATAALSGLFGIAVGQRMNQDK